MKSATPALVAYLNALRPTKDAPLLTASLFTVTLASGAVLTYTDLDIPVSWNGYVYLSNSLLFSGLRYKCAIGVSVDKQQIIVFARPTDTFGGVPFLQALQQGLLDGATVQREQAFFSAWGTVPIGAVIMFKGRVAEIGDIGRTSAKITVASELCLLDIDMPRNVWQPNCLHVFCDSGCGLAAGTYSTTGTVAAGSSVTAISWSGATAAYQQGVILFTSGANAGVEVTVSAASAGWLQLAYPLPHAPSVGDGFAATQGCDHTASSCLYIFNNIANFRGFPYVPPPQIMTGPLYSSVSFGGK